jgi:hypothetical protein
VRMAPELELRKHHRTVHRHLERPPGGLDQPDLGLGESLTQLGRQTGGPGMVVSDDAELNRDHHGRPLWSSDTATKSTAAR